MVAEVEALMAKLKMKDNQINGFLHIFVHFNAFC